MSGDWNLIRYESKNAGAKTTQLFNLAKNPDELLKEHHDPKVTALTGRRPAVSSRIRFPGLVITI
jgi:hypothetical protein